MDKINKVFVTLLLLGKSISWYTVGVERTESYHHEVLLVLYGAP